MTTRKVRRGGVRTIREDAAEPAWVLASNRRFLGGQQAAQDRIVEAYPDGPILAEGHGPGSRAFRLLDVLAAGRPPAPPLRPPPPPAEQPEHRGRARGVPAR